MSNLSPIALSAQTATAMMRVRRARDQILPCELFADKSWDILLLLKASGQMDLDDLQCALGMSDSLFLRRAEILESKDLIQISGMAVTLTPGCSHKLDCILSEAVLATGAPALPEGERQAPTELDFANDDSAARHPISPKAVAMHRANMFKDRSVGRSVTTAQSADTSTDS